MIAEALAGGVVAEQPVEWEALWEADDLTLVLNHGCFLTYVELWVESRWEGIYEKPEYKQLSRDAALHKFVAERLSAIAAIFGLKVTQHSIKCEEGYDEDKEEADWLLTAKLDFC